MVSEPPFVQLRGVPFSLEPQKWPELSWSCAPEGVIYIVHSVVSVVSWSCVSLWPGLEAALQAEQPRLFELSFPTSAGGACFIFENLYFCFKFLNLRKQKFPFLKSLNIIHLF